MKQDHEDLGGNKSDSGQCCHLLLQSCVNELARHNSSRVVHSSYIKISKGDGVNVVEFSDQFFPNYFEF